VVERKKSTRLANGSTDRWGLAKVGRSEGNWAEKLRFQDRCAGNLFFFFSNSVLFFLFRFYSQILNSKVDLDKV
jgi:hypothetical protein